MRTYYRSRISIPLWIGIWGFLIQVMAFSLELDFSFSNLISSYIEVMICGIFFLFVGILCFGIRYGIKEECLTIKIGPLVERKINIQEIKSIERSYDLEASPANALRRLRLNYKNRYVLISPSSEKEFIKHLKTINPNIEVYILEKTLKFQAYKLNSFQTVNPEKLIIN